PEHGRAVPSDLREGAVTKPVAFAVAIPVTPAVAIPVTPAASPGPVERHVEHGGGVPFHDRDPAVRRVPALRSEPHCANAERKHAAVGVREIRMMAGRARDVSLAREDGIPEEEAAELCDRDLLVPPRDGGLWIGARGGRGRGNGGAGGNRRVAGYGVHHRRWARGRRSWDRHGHRPTSARAVLVRQCTVLIIERPGELRTCGSRFIRGSFPRAPASP